MLDHLHALLISCQSNDDLMGKFKVSVYEHLKS